MRKIDVLSGGDPLPNYLTYHLIRYALHTTYHVTSVQYIVTVVYSMSDHVTVLYSASSSSQSETSIWGHVNNIQPIRGRYLGYCDHVSVLYSAFYI